MNPGRELDALVAEKVMELKNIRKLNTEAIKDFVYDRPNLITGLHVIEDLVPEYSTDIAAAWEVVERLAEYHGNKCDLDYGEFLEGLWTVRFGFGNDSCSAETAPHAICLAALKVVEKEPLGNNQP